MFRFTRSQDEPRDGGPRNDDESLMSDEELEAVSGGTQIGEPWGPKPPDDKDQDGRLVPPSSIG